MEKFDRKKKFLIFVFGAFLYILILVFLFERRGLIDVLNSRRELTRLQKEVEVLKEKKGKLEWEIKILKENPEAVGEMARKDLGFVYPDEIIVLIDEKNLSYQK